MPPGAWSSRRRSGLDIGFALPLLAGDGDIILGPPRRRDAQVKGGVERDWRRD